MAAIFAQNHNECKGASLVLLQFNMQPTIMNVLVLAIIGAVEVREAIVFRNRGKEVIAINLGF